MNEQLNRREFVSASLGVLAAGAGLAAAPPADKLPQRTLGRTGVKAGILGLGGVGFLTDWENKDNIAVLINEAIDAGVNYFDTARSYGKGVSEDSLGLVMNTRRRKEVFLASKTYDRSYDGAMREIETSLKALRTDYLDLIQVHAFASRDTDDVAKISQKDGVLTAMQRLRDQKMVRFIGVTGHPNLAKFKDVTNRYDFDTVLCWVNPRETCRWVENEIIPLARNKKMGVIAMKVLGGSKPAALVGDGPGKASAAQLIRFSLSADIDVALTAVADAKQLRENLEAARNFKPLAAAERQALLTRINQPVNNPK